MQPTAARVYDERAAAAEAGAFGGFSCFEDRMSTRRLLTVEMVVLVLPCTILWVMTAPPMGLVLVKAGPGGLGSWLPLWLGGGLFGLIALWRAHFDQVSDRRARLQPWQWAGLAAGISASLSLVVPSLMKTPAFPLPAVLQVVIALPVVAAIRVVARQEGHAGEKRTG